MTPETLSVVGRTLTNLFRTDWGEPRHVLPGIRPFYYYSVVLEIDGVERLELYFDGLHEWRANEKLFPVDPREHGAEPGLRIVGEKITEVRTDSDEIVSLVLASNVEICVTPDSGTSLHLGPCLGESE